MMNFPNIDELVPDIVLLSCCVYFIKLTLTEYAMSVYKKLLLFCWNFINNLILDCRFDEFNFVIVAKLYDKSLFFYV